MQFAVRFWSRVDISEDAGACWSWLGCLNRNGYGVVSDNGRKLAHRVAWRLRHGREPHGLVMHACDNPKCVNPDHLAEGTQADNMADAAAKGRTMSGERHRQIMATRLCRGNGRITAKLTDDTVRNMRKRHASGETIRAIAREVGVDSATAWKAIHRRTWTHVI